MRLEFYIARRYLFAKKSKNIINIISMISMIVVAFVAAAMVVVLSAFSGIDQLVKGLFSNFDAPLTIVPDNGRSFPDSIVTDAFLHQFPEITGYSRIIEEDAWFNCIDHNAVATLKGVETNYNQLSTIDSVMYLGDFILEKDSAPFAVVGLGVRGELMMPYSDEVPTFLHINAPIKGRKLSRYQEDAFNKMTLQASGVFSANAELDMKYVFVPLSFARELFEMPNDISSIELMVEESNVSAVKARLEQQLPAGLKVQTRIDKNALIYKTNASEKWFTFLVLFFILIIACFNIIASLTMLIIEKKKDIYVLSSMGASRQLIERIFMVEGIFINALGGVIGTSLGLAACWIQENYGIITMEGAVVEYYPVAVQWQDVVGIFITVILTGTLFCVTLVRALMKRFAWQKGM